MYDMMYSRMTIAVMACLAMMSCHNTHGNGHAESEHEHEHEEGVIHFSHKQAEAAHLTVETVKAADFEEYVRVSGQVMPAQGDELAVVARSSGVVSFVRDHLTEGSSVRAGETICRVSASGIAGGDIMAQNNVNLSAAKAAYERAKALVADSVISHKAYEEARRVYDNAVLAAGGHAAAKGEGSVALSPLSGYVKNVAVRSGEYVETGQLIATVTKVCNLQLRAEVPEKYFGRLSSIRSANFQMGYDEEVRRLDELGGHLIAIGKTADEGSAFIPVTFEFQNRGNIVPGSFADIWLITGKRPGVLSVPKSAITEEQGIYYVYVQLADDDEYEKREVTIGGGNGLRCEIVKGLKVGEKVVVNGVTQVKLAANTSVPEAHSHSH